MEQEIWKPIKDWPYEISNYGQVRRSESNSGYAKVGKILNQMVHKTRGYKTLSLYRSIPIKDEEELKNRKFNYISDTIRIDVHRLVASTFLGEQPKGIQVNHIDGNKLNNYVGNLEYITHQENMEHARRTGLMPSAKGSKQGKAKLDENTVIIIREKLKLGISEVKRRHLRTYISKEFNVSYSTIRGIEIGKNWTHI